MRKLLQCALCLWYMSVSVSGLIHHLDIKNDKRSTFEIETFGFVDNGVINITVRDFSFSTAKSHSNHHHQKKDFNLTAVSTDYKVSLLLRQAPSETEAQKDLEAALESGKCLLDDPREHDIVLDLAPALTSHRVSFHRSIPSSPGAAGLYSLIFVRCKPASASYHVNFRMDAVFANPGPNYLPAGETPFPLLYLLLCLLYCICLSLWIWVVCCSKNAGASTFMHHLMTALMALKCLSLLAESVRFHFIAQTGVSEGWSVLYYVFTSLKSTMLFLVILLIGSGWAHVKPFLHSREKNIIAVVLLLQVLDNVAMVVIEETSPGSVGWLTWRDILHIVDIMCCCAMLFPIFWSINHFRQGQFPHLFRPIIPMCFFLIGVRMLTVTASESDGKARDSLAKLQLFKTFYVMVLLYIYFSRVVVFLLTATLPFQLQWLGQLALELGTLLFFAITGYKFQPSLDSGGLYSRVSGEDEEGEFGLTLQGARTGRSGSGDSEEGTGLALREAFSGDCDQDL